MIKRDLYPKVKAHLLEREITLITGPRQAGKTTLMEMLMEDLRKQNKPYVYLNLDREEDKAFLDSQAIFLDYLQLQLGTSSYSYVFIDEIQRKDNAGIFLKGLYDSNLPYKFIISGSGSVELKEKVSEGLSGRKKTFKLRTVSFKEFVNYKTAYQYEDRLAKYMTSSFYDGGLLEEYMYFGGYPKVITVDTVEKKRDVLESIYDSYVDKDLKDLLSLQKPAAIRDLLTFLSLRVGSLTSFSEIANRVNLSFNTVKQYLYYLEKTFQIEPVRPYSTNPETELTKMPTFYFSDLGMRNYVFNRLSHYDPLVSGPMLFQNFVYLQLVEKEFVSKVNYWRTKDGAEVDFIASTGALITPVEVKFRDLDKPEVSRSMSSFIKSYATKEFLVVNKTLVTETPRDDTKVVWVPYTEFAFRRNFG